MAEEGGEKSGMAELASSVKEIRAVLDALGPGESSVAEDSPPASVPDNASLDPGLRMARDAAAKFRKTMAWMVGAVSAVALVIFGSGPFLIDREPFWDNRAVLAGLGAVAFGVALVLFGASKVYEPEDQSLGELNRSFERIDFGNPMFIGQKAALRNLKAILDSESSAHLGPGMTSVRGLIKKIDQLQSDRLPNLLKLDATRLEVEKAAAVVTRLSAEREALTVAITKLLERSFKSDEPGADRAIEERDLLIGSLRRHRNSVDALLAQAHRRAEIADSASRMVEQAIAPQDTELNLYLLYRNIVMSEALVAEMRGTFRGARRLLFAGALLTLAGGAVYLTGTGASDNGGDSKSGSAAIGVAVTLEIPGTAAFSDALPDGCFDRGLDAQYHGGAYPAQGAGFEITIIEPRCRATIEIPVEYYDGESEIPDVELRVSTSGE